MSDKFLAYLGKEHDRLEKELETARRQTVPDEFLIARLKKLKLYVRDQIAWYERSADADHAA